MKLGFFTMPMHPPGRDYTHGDARQSGSRSQCDVRRGHRPDTGNLAGDAPYNLKGQFWNLSTERTLIREAGQGVMLKPYQKPHPPIVVKAIVPHSKGLVAAARRGWTPITANFLQPNWAATHWPMHAQGCELDGRKAGRRDWRVCKSIFVADDDATAQRYAKSLP